MIKIVPKADVFFKSHVHENQSFQYHVLSREKVNEIISIILFKEYVDCVTISID